MCVTQWAAGAMSRSLYMGRFLTDGDKNKLEMTERMTFDKKKGKKKNV